MKAGTAIALSGWETVDGHSDADMQILLGVHGNGLTHLIWMPATPRSAVIEMFFDGGFARDCEWATAFLQDQCGHSHALHGGFSTYFSSFTRFLISPHTLLHLYYNTHTPTLVSSLCPALTTSAFASLP